MKIVLDPATVSHHPPFLEELRTEFPAVDFQVATTVDEMKRQISNADVYHGMPTREVFLAAKRLRWIAVSTVGINGVADIPELIKSEVVVTNARAPGHSPHADPLADHVFGMMLILAHQWKRLLDNQREHHWGSGEYTNQFVELNGTIMGILALGDIGKAVARRAPGFGIDVYAVDTLQIPAPPEVKEVWGLERLDDLLRISDWFVVAAPGTPETRGMIDKRRIGLMKKSAHMIVISRGGIVDENAMIEAIKSGRLAGAGLDVMAQEPLPKDNPLWDTKNVILSPHTAHVTPEMFVGHRNVFKENLRRFLANQPFLYVCDKKAGY